jgi:hypothetical protein
MPAMDPDADQSLSQTVKIPDCHGWGAEQTGSLLVIHAQGNKPSPAACSSSSVRWLDVEDALAHMRVSWYLHSHEPTRTICTKVIPAEDAANHAVLTLG